MRQHWIGLGAAALLAAGIWHVQAGEKKAKPEETGKDDGSALVKRGQYLVNEMARCVGCHTPRDAKGKPDTSRLLQGISPPPRAAGEPKKGFSSPDITHSGLAGKWSDEDLAKFLTTGVNPDGDEPSPPMPAYHLHEDDARAITLYLKSLPGKSAPDSGESGEKDKN